MKLFLLSIILVAVVSMAKGQTSFIISGTINGINSGNVTLVYVDQGQPQQLSAKIKNGNFIFNGSLGEPQRLMINFSNDHFSGETNFFGGNEDIFISIDTAHPGHPLISGSATQKDFEHYNELVKDVEKKSESLNKTGAALYLSGKLTESLKDSLFAVRDKLDQEKRTIIAGFAKEHPASAVSAWAISIFYGFDPNLDELLPVFNSLSEKNQQSLYGKQITEIIGAAKKTLIGTTAANFTANNPDGKPVSLSSYKGKFVLVDFWASWCGPCRAENPNVVNMYRKYHSDQFDILGVSLDASKDAWVKAIKNDKLEWQQVSDLRAWESKIVTSYGLKGLPFNMLLDKDGKIIAKNLRGPALEMKLKEVLN